MLKPSQPYNFSFSTRSSGTGSTNADSMPSAVARTNGAVDVSFALTVTNVGTGKYRISGTVPNTYVAGDIVQIEVTATLGGVTESLTVDSFTIDTARPSDVLARLGLPTLATIAADIQSRLAASAYTAPTTPPTALQIRQEIDANSTKLDVAVGTRLATTGYTAPDNTGIATLLARLSAARAGYLDNLNGIVAAIWAGVVNSPGVTTLLARIPSNLTITGGKVDVNDKTNFSLTVADKENIAVRTEAHLLDEGDSQPLINALVTAIGNTNVNQTALVAAIRSDIERSGGTLATILADYARRTGDAATPASVAALGTLIGNLNNLSQAQVTAALTGYGAATTTQATANKNEILAALPDDPDNADIADIKTKVLTLTNAPSATDNANAVRAQLTDATLASAAATGVLATPDNKLATNPDGSVNATGGGTGGPGTSADEIWNHPKAQELLDDVGIIVEPFKAVDPQRPVIVVNAPTAPVAHQVAVLFNPTHMGKPADASVKFAFTDKAPVLIATTNETITPSSPQLDAEFTVLAGCFLYTSDYLEEQKSSGIYYADSKECNYNQTNARFKVPPLPSNRDFWYLSELLAMFRTGVYPSGA